VRTGDAKVVKRALVLRGAVDTELKSGRTASRASHDARGGTCGQRMMRTLDR
jgi:hypothetical protein